MATADGDQDDEEPEEEVPMLHLASFAIHKLFSEWQSEGFNIPDFKTGQVPPGGVLEEPEAMAQSPSAPIAKSELPPNALSIHPTSLLCMVSESPCNGSPRQTLISSFSTQMRPGVKYVDLGSEGKTPNLLHRVGVDIDSIKYIGSGTSKKLARKNAAVKACNTLFNVGYPADEN